MLGALPVMPRAKPHDGRIRMPAWMPAWRPARRDPRIAGRALAATARVGPRREARRLTLWLQGGAGVPRRVDIPVATIAMAVLCIAACVAGSIEYGVSSEARARSLQIQAARLSVEATAGARAEGQLSQLQQQAASLKETLKTITQLDGQVRAEAGAPTSNTTTKATAGLPSSDPAVSHLDAAGGVLRQLQQAIPALAHDVQNLGQSMTGWTADAAHTPSIWPVQGPITSPVGARLNPFNTAQSEIHTGVDIGVVTGTPVHATADGTVVFAGWNYIYGNQVIVSVGGGLDTMFGHNSRLLVRSGQQVAKGQVIALSGSTGWSTGPHVHYEIDQNGQPVNPAPYLPGYAEVAGGGGAGSVEAGSAGNFGYGGR